MSRVKARLARWRVTHRPYRRVRLWAVAAAMMGLVFLAESLGFSEVSIWRRRFDGSGAIATSLVPSHSGGCVGCHLGIDQATQGGAAAPFGAHSGLGVLVGAGSPHSLAEHACGACHGGDATSRTFLGAGHRARSSEQAEHWRRQYGYSHAPDDAPIALGSDLEVSCGRCHPSEVLLSGAKVLAQGERTFFDLGCRGCHEVARWPMALLAGPDLGRVRAKLTREWIYSWLLSPRAFRGDARAGSHFLLWPSASGDDLPASQSTRARALATYLTTASQTWPEAARPFSPGVAEDGERLLARVGCLACHSSDLAGIGSKVSERWLFHFLRRPSAYARASRMPSMGLTEVEAAALAAALAKRSAPTFEPRWPVLDRRAAEELDGLLGALDITAAKGVSLDRLSTGDKDAVAGEALFVRLGCSGCHALGSVRVDRRRVALPAREKSEILELLAKHADASPNPGSHPSVAASERDAVATFLAGLAARAERAARPHRLTDQVARFFAHGLGCDNCHEMFDTAAVARASGPSLVGEGRKVRADWLFRYLSESRSREASSGLRMPQYSWEMFAEDTRAGHGVDPLNAVVLSMVDGARRDGAQPGFFEPTAGKSVGAASGAQLFGKCACGSCHGEGGRGSRLAGSGARLRPSWLSTFLSHHGRCELTSVELEALVAHVSAL